MILFLRPKDLARERNVSILIGTGLLGSSVARHLSSGGHVPVFQQYVNWANDSRRNEVYERFKERALTLLGDAPSVSVIWCAGKGSLSASTDQLDPERRAFGEMLRLANSLTDYTHVSIHFLSSAGALFEGRRLVEPESIPSPQSAYGLMKLDQESLLCRLSSTSPIDIQIYRPSTVYGSHEFHRRAGLVSHIIWNALRSTPTVLEANLHALRDYVHHSDIGQFIAMRVARTRQREFAIHFLVSAKPTSIREILLRIERLVGHSLVYRLNLSGVNSADITFSDRVLPSSWRPMPLEIGLSEVWRDTRQAFLSEKTESRATEWRTQIPQL